MNPDNPNTGVSLVILGSGTSHGVPMIGCDCDVCTSPDPRDRRTRPSVLFRYENASILIDTSPELRLQCLANDVRRVDALLYTHYHADHVAGLDDIRRFNWLQQTALPVFATPDTHRELRRMFAYAFDRDPAYPSAIPAIDACTIDGPFTLFGRTVTPIPIWHGKLPVLGFRIGNIAYCTDCNRIPDESRALLRDLDVLVLDGLRRRPHPTHFNVEQATAVAAEIGARHTYLTHIAHELPHAATERELPDAVSLAYDGLILEESQPTKPDAVHPV